MARLGVDVRHPLRKLEGVGQGGAAGGAECALQRSEDVLEHLKALSGQRLTAVHGQGLQVLAHAIMHAPAAFLSWRKLAAVRGGTPACSCLGVQAVHDRSMERYSVQPLT